jgi:DNA-directed RNA polymerase subunit RPC12/RpoP
VRSENAHPTQNGRPRVNLRAASDLTPPSGTPPGATIRLRCRECGRMIDCLDAILTSGYHLCPSCLSKLLRGRSPKVHQALCD